MTGVFDLFSIGVGPSSSHTVGPMRAAGRLVHELASIDDARARHLPLPDAPQVAPPPSPGAPSTSDEPLGLTDVQDLRVELFGSLGATGLGHGTDKAVLVGLMGAHPETVEPAASEDAVAELRRSHRLVMLGGSPLRQHVLEDFDPDRAIALRPNKRLPYHPNALRFHLRGAAGWRHVTYYSTGGGFVVRDDGTGRPMHEGVDSASTHAVPYPFATGAELLQQCLSHGLGVAQVMLADEAVGGRPPQSVMDGLAGIWGVMAQAIDAGCATSGTLPGGLGVRRRAQLLAQQLQTRAAGTDSLAGLDWVSLWALAVSEVNASGGRVVTAPTNGAAGIIPAVLRYALTLPATQARYGAAAAVAADFLLTAGAIGLIYKQQASISGAEVGCQGEVGVASSMASAGLAQVLGGTPQQVLNAAEIGLEHHLGLTCDPVGGLVQVPCIERNAIGATTAITSARLAMAGDGNQVVSLDQVIASMMEIGADMSTKYKETSQGGLAHVVEC